MRVVHICIYANQENIDLQKDNTNYYVIAWLGVVGFSISQVSFGWYWLVYPDLTGFNQMYPDLS